MARRVTGEDQRRVRALAGVINADIAREDDRIRGRLAALKRVLDDDYKFRGVVVRGDDRGYALDYAGNAMRVAGLDFLQIQDDEGRIVSSGHFRNEFDRLGPALPGAGPVLVRAATAEGSFLALVSSDTMSIGVRRFRLLGGVAVDSQFLARLARDPELGVRLSLPNDTSNADSGKIVVGPPTTLPYVDAVDGPGRVEQARIVVTRSSALLTALQRNVNLWFAAAVLVAALAALLLAGWLSTRISTPIEARIAIGDLARQVNHDLKNGLAPLRNVFRHLTQVARDKPDELPHVFTERQGTVESSIDYLETLPANYAKLSPQSERKATDVNAVVRETIGGGGGGASSVKAKLADGLPVVTIDALVLRRVIENLVSNAVDSLEGKNGTVMITTERGHGLVRIAVSDTGRGMTK